uniref:Uncharacterized protein n=1 Tax=Anguilla anguilla TaxID=7936 RepID=A0A0E9VMN3_ANGAN
MQKMVSVGVNLVFSVTAKTEHLLLQSFSRLFQAHTHTR